MLINISFRRLESIKTSLQVGCPQFIDEAFLLQEIQSFEKYSTATQFIYAMRRLGLIDGKGQLTLFGHEWLIDDDRQSVYLRMLQSIWPEGANRVINNEEVTRQDIKEYLGNVGYGESTIEVVSSSLYSLVNLAAGKRIPLGLFKRKKSIQSINKTASGQNPPLKSSRRFEYGFESGGVATVEIPKSTSKLELRKFMRKLEIDLFDEEGDH